MATKKKKPTRVRPAGSTAQSRFTILLEAIEQQNRATIEAVFSTRDELRREFNEKFERVDQRLSTLEFVARHHTSLLEQHGERLTSLETKVDVLQEDVRVLQKDVRHLTGLLETKADKAQVDRLEERVTALEARLGA